MLPPRVEAAIQAIASNRRSGASTIARNVLDALDALLASTESRPALEEVREAARRISAFQPAMSLVHNVVNLFVGLVESGQDPGAVLAEIRSELDSIRERVARTFLKIAPDSAEVITVSFSENVLACIKKAHEQHRIARVHVMESRPLLEGRTLASALSDAGIPTSLVPDALGPGLMNRATYALVGADSVLRDGSVVNKIGTYALALGAADQGKPTYVACETLKFDPRYEAASWPGSPSREGQEVWDHPAPNIDVTNRYFEITPGRLIRTFVTERGTYAPDLIPTMLARAKGQK